MYSSRAADIDRCWAGDSAFRRSGSGRVLVGFGNIGQIPVFSSPLIFIDGDFHASRLDRERSGRVPRSHTQSPFAWLEVVAPPLIVLSTAYVLKEQALESIEQRHANVRAFQEALAEWQTATTNPEDHPQWLQFYANVLRGVLLKAKNRRKEALSQMTEHDWCIVVTREMEADLWYEQPEQDEM